MHVREKSLNKITDSDTVSTEEMIAYLEHLDQCDFCLDQMIEEEIRNTDQPAPDYLAEQILNRAAAPDVQAAKAVRTTSRKMQLFYYGLRTATGMIAALFLLFVIQHFFRSFYSGIRQICHPHRSQRSPGNTFTAVTEYFCRAFTQL